MSMQAIYDWASTQTASPVIWANQDGPQPELPYVTLQVTADNREGMAHVGCIDADGIATIQQGQILSVSVQTWGNSALGLVQGLRNSLEKPTVQRGLRESGLAYVRVTLGPQDVPDVTGTTFQARAVMDVQFRAAVTLTDDLGVIESIAFEGSDGTASPAGDTVERV